MRWTLCVWMLLAGSTASAAAAGPLDAAGAFGARENVSDMTLSPDGRSVAYIVPTEGPGSALLTLDLADGSKARVALATSGKPERLGDCHWVSNDRLVCRVFWTRKLSDGLSSLSRLVAADRAGTNQQNLSDEGEAGAHYNGRYGGEVIDWLPDSENTLLMDHWTIPTSHIGSRTGSWRQGLGVDLVDTRTRSSKPVEMPLDTVAEYISDGRGNVRIRAIELNRTADYRVTGHVGYQYRRKGSRDWLDLGEYNQVEETGFLPVAVDPDKDIAYGYRKKDGRWAVFAVALDGSRTEQLVYANPEVDVTSLLRIGRRNRVVGVRYATDQVYNVYLDPDIERLMKSLAHALPQRAALRLVDSSADEQVLVIHAGSDDDPGVYYVFDRRSKQLRTFLVSRDPLEGRRLAQMKPIRYPAADGTLIPAYLTLPPGKEDAQGLPAIVLPHGGPSSRDYWGFDWLPQFYAAQGYAVLQPNFRGSAGYGDAWIQQNGFKSWRVAIGDVLDAGHWLVAQGIADPAKLGIVGWSYGGYAALQSAVVEPGLFRAVVAIAPVTDLELLKATARDSVDFLLVEQEIGEGPHLREGSPAKNAERIRVPVLLFHGALDRNVDIRQSQLMAERLDKAGVSHELVTWDYLDHQLVDSAARAEMLRKSDEFLRRAIGIDR